MSYDHDVKVGDEGYFDWKVTRSLVSYDIELKNEQEELQRLKGHQIIGELRHKNNAYHKYDRHWKVTRSLVSYDRLKLSIIYQSLHWKVTRSLVSYDCELHLKTSQDKIERSPDHWWVTTINDLMIRDSIVIERSPDHWWVTTLELR